MPAVVVVASDGRYQALSDLPLRAASSCRPDKGGPLRQGCRRAIRVDRGTGC
jgi:hypothetical protein